MEWISVKDRLPKTHEWVAVCIADGSQYAISRYEGGHSGGWATGCVLLRGPIAWWMPLPEPPAPRAWKWRKWGWSNELFRDDKHVTHDLVCAALNGSARELLEFAGITEECEDGVAYPPFYSKSNYSGDPGYYQITNEHGVPFSVIDIVALLNNRKCVCGHHK